MWAEIGFYSLIPRLRSLWEEKTSPMLPRKARNFPNECKVLNFKMCVLVVGRRSTDAMVFGGTNLLATGPSKCELRFQVNSYAVAVTI